MSASGACSRITRRTEISTEQSPKLARVLEGQEEVAGPQQSGGAWVGLAVVLDVDMSRDSGLESQD